MKVVVFSAKPYDRESLAQVNATYQHELTFLDFNLTKNTVALAQGYPVVCAFVNDQLDAPVLEKLHQGGCRLIALRCAGFNHVDLKVATELGIQVVRVPAYSPHAVAEHALTLIMDLNRRVYRAYNQVRHGNFALNGLLGFDMFQKTVGVVGTGKIGEVMCQILRGLGCQILAYDVVPNPACEAMGVRYVDLPTLFQESHIISLHCPLTPSTYHLINEESLALMKPGVMIINTSRGAVLDTKAAIQGLKSGKIGYLGLDVYEEEGDLFFEDLSNQVIQDDTFMRLVTFPNVVVTAHQAFFTREALEKIAQTTLGSIADFDMGKPLVHAVRPEQFQAPA